MKRLPYLILRLLVGLTILGLLTALSAASILAAPPPSQPVATYRIPMTLDCSRVPDTAQARAALTKSKLCGYGQRSGDITIDNTVPGDCGWLSVYVYNSGGGYMQWKGEIGSTLGVFVHAYYNATWANTTTGGSNSFSRTYWGWTSDWLDIFPIYTGAGYVVGRIGFAQADLAWGGICYNTLPADHSVWVS